MTSKVETWPLTQTIRTWTRSRTLDAATDLGEVIFEAARRLYRDRIDLGGEGVRLLGVGAQALFPVAAPRQETLFSDAGRERAGRAERLVDSIRASQGRGSIGPARLLRGVEPDPERPLTPGDGSG